MEITNRQWEITVTRSLGDQWPDMADEAGTFRPDTVNVALEAIGDGGTVPRVLPVTVSGALRAPGSGRAMVDVQLDDKTPPWVAKTVEAACISVRLRDGGDDDSER